MSRREGTMTSHWVLTATSLAETRSGSGGPSFLGPAGRQLEVPCPRENRGGTHSTRDRVLGSVGPLCQRITLAGSGENPPCKRSTPFTLQHSSSSSRTSSMFLTECARALPCTDAAASGAQSGRTGDRPPAHFICSIYCSMCFCWGSGAAAPNGYIANGTGDHPVSPHLGWSSMCFFWGTGATAPNGCIASGTGDHPISPHLCGRSRYHGNHQAGQFSQAHIAFNVAFLPSCKTGGRWRTGCRQQEPCNTVRL